MVGSTVEILQEEGFDVVVARPGQQGQHVRLGVVPNFVVAIE